MSRQRIIKIVVGLCIISAVVYIIDPRDALRTYQLGHSFAEWDQFGERIRAADAVEILVIGRRAVPEQNADIDGYDRYIAHAKVRVEGDALRPLTHDWHMLIYSPRHTHLCHSPPYGVRYFKGPKTIAEATFCWVCGNIYLSSHGAQGLYGFDPAAGRWLLDELQKIAPLPERSSTDP